MLPQWSLKLLDEETLQKRCDRFTSFSNKDFSTLIVIENESGDAKVSSRPGSQLKADC